MPRKLDKNIISGSVYEGVSGKDCPLSRWMIKIHPHQGRKHHLIYLELAWTREEREILCF